MGIINQESIFGNNYFFRKTNKTLSKKITEIVEIEKGMCFYNCLQSLRVFPASLYVEGHVLGIDGVFYEHAWLQMEGEVIDPTYVNHVDLDKFAYIKSYDLTLEKIVSLKFDEVPFYKTFPDLETKILNQAIRLSDLGFLPSDVYENVKQMVEDKNSGEILDLQNLTTTGTKEFIIKCHARLKELNS